MRLSVPIAAAVFVCGLAFTLSGRANGTNLVVPEPSQTYSRIELPKPRAHRKRPLAVVLADNKGTETTDFMIPIGVLRQSGAIDVVSASTQRGAVALMPALRVEADFTLNGFDRANPEGADIVIVPAMHDARNPEILAWLKTQASRGATIVSICEGARIVAAAGLLEGRKATTHWYAIEELAEDYPRTVWIKDRRYVADGNIISTTGVTASIPVSLALVEAIAGRAVAQRTAATLGVAEWSSAHDTDAFEMPLRMKFRAAANILGFWDHETVGFRVSSGIDDIALALSADAWSRTYRSSAVAINPAGHAVTSHGIRLLTEREPNLHLAPALPGQGSRSLDHTLKAIEERFGPMTARFVAMQLEYPVNGVEMSVPLARQSGDQAE